VSECSCNIIVAVERSNMLYYISNEVLLVDCDKYDILEITRTATKTVKRFVYYHVLAQSPPGRRPSDTYPVNFAPLPISAKLFHPQYFW
jgi:hypothetical protein